MPREEGGHIAVRPFDITASDVDVLLELKPEGKVREGWLPGLVCQQTYQLSKDETVVTVGVTDLNIYDTTTSNRNCFLSLTTPRLLVCTTYSLQLPL